MDSFFLRYQRGEYQKVWEELVALGENVHNEHIFPDALSVAKETMRRVRQNIGLLIPRLEALGYEFGYAWLAEEPGITEEWITSQPVRYAPPSFDIEQRIHDFEQLAGPLPLSLRAFYTEVGEVNFFGRHPLWEQFFEFRDKTTFRLPNLDPLAVSGLKDELFEDYRLWKEQMQDEGEDRVPYPLFIALDYELKYNVSGAGAYEIEIPSRKADEPLLNEWHETTFVNFLRICLHYGGLPGLEGLQERIPKELSYLRKDLMPF